VIKLKKLVTEEKKMGKTARNAVKLATKSLDTIREIRDSGKEKPEIYELT
jgi:GTP cyclohydrolase IIa